jgi:CRP-like cAMP-binding protein
MLMLSIDRESKGKSRNKRIWAWRCAAQRKTLVAREDFQILRSGERTNAAGKPVSNKVLLSIPASEYLAIRPHLEFLSMPHHLSLYEPNDPLEFVYFPNGGMVSLVIAMADGRTVEVGEVGKEGFAGIPAATGMKRSQVREVVQIAGNGFRVRVGALQSVLRSTPQLQLILTRYAVGQGLQIAQTAACNRLHNIEERFARWLLVTQDRVDSAMFAITHDFLATMLGTDRPTISLAAGILQKKQAIVYTRGAVQIVNRAKLEKCACECYGAIQLDRYGEGPLHQGKTFKPRTRPAGQ